MTPENLIYVGTTAIRDREALWDNLRKRPFNKQLFENFTVVAFWYHFNNMIYAEMSDEDMPLIQIMFRPHRLGCVDLDEGLQRIS